MDHSELSQLEALFHRLADLPAGPEREAAAAIYGGQDAELARRALALVDSDEKARAANDAARSAIAEPRLYGKYRTVRPLGSGGMGAVYLAERVDGQFRQTVALKVIAPHVAGDAFRDRFLAERQILAELNHPNITKLLDGGVTAEGTPYLVMEHVDGLPLDCYCDAQKSGLRERLELFLKVCAPVAYAHRALVVHRDLKPSNILVTGEGEPMLLDFGTAKLLADADNSAQTILPFATPRYSSPEQWSHAPVTTSSDVFSLGVILYELVTGAWPFGDPASPQQMVERFARDTPMAPPQTVVTEEASLARSAQVRSLRSSLAGDLCNVLGKALAPDPANRYDSVQALAADVSNWLAGRPVSARSPSVSYRAAKFLRRHWVPSLAAAVFFLGLLASTAFALREAELARAEAVKADQVNQFLNGMLSSASPLTFDPGRFTVSQMLDAAAARLAESGQRDPLIEATLRKSLGNSYQAIQNFDAARAQLEKALAIFRRLGRTSDEAEALYLLGVNAGEAGAPVESVGYYREALARWKNLGNRAPPLAVFRTKSALADELSAVLNQDPEEADRLFVEALELAGRDPSIPRTELGIATNERGALLLGQGRTADAEAAFYRALELYRQANYEGAGKGQPFYMLAILNSRRDDFAAARKFARQFYEITLRAIGPDHRRTTQAKLMWARFRAETGEIAEAVQVEAEAMPLVRKALPPLSSALWTPLSNASRILTLARRFAEAEPLAREQLVIVDRHQLPEVDSRRAGSLVELGNALRGQKKYGEAVHAFERADRIYEQLGPAWARRVEQVRQILAELPASPK